tara:strand:- start:870 stop:1133 length:264 start_codon:yes stop_codon:yes gene_type:complete
MRPIADDLTGYRPGPSFITEFAKEICHCGFRKSINQVGGWSTARGIKSHVDRSIALEGESSTCFVELKRGNTEVEKYALRMILLVTS